MTYNMHPIFVHFPIAFLLVYSLVKIIPFYRWLPNVAWLQVQRVLLFVGVLGAFAALSTGEIAEHLTGPDSQLVDMHATFANISTWAYSLILVGEILILLIPIIIKQVNLPKIVKLLSILKSVLTKKTVSVLLASVGLVAIIATGLLGGVMVYGTSADPIAGFVLKILGIDI